MSSETRAEEPRQVDAAQPDGGAPEARREAGGWKAARWVRRAVQIAFFALFVYLLFAALQRYEPLRLADGFFRFDPLAAVGTMIAGARMDRRLLPWRWSPSPRRSCWAASGAAGSARSAPCSSGARSRAPSGGRAGCRRASGASSTSCSTSSSRWPPSAACGCWSSTRSRCSRARRRRSLIPALRSRRDRRRVGSFSGRPSSRRRLVGRRPAARPRAARDRAALRSDDRPGARVRRRGAARSARGALLVPLPLPARGAARPARQGRAPAARRGDGLRPLRALRRGVRPGRDRAAGRRARRRSRRRAARGRAVRRQLRVHDVSRLPGGVPEAGRDALRARDGGRRGDGRPVGRVRPRPPRLPRRGRRRGRRHPAPLGRRAPGAPEPGPAAPAGRAGRGRASSRSACAAASA